ncbi:MAG: oligosaccharide flippase family protein [Pyrinomonadaceae bacterium]
MTETESIIQPLTPPPSRRFSRSVGITLVARAAQVVASLGANILIARWLGESGLGALAVINVTMAVALQLASLGLPSANVYFIAKDHRRLGPLWANTMLFGLLAGIGVAVLVAALVYVRPQLFGEVPPRLLVIAVIAVPVQFLTLVGLNLMLGLDRVIAYNLCDTLANSMSFVSAIITLIAFSGGLALLVYGNALGAILVGVTVSALIFKFWRQQTGHESLRPSGELFYHSLRYGLKFHLAILANLLLVRIDLLLVNHYNGTREAGIYAAAAQIGTLLLLLPGVVSNLLFPRVAAEADRTGEFAMRVTRHLALIMFLACVATVPASLLLPIMYGAKFTPAVMLLLLLLPGVFLLGVESVLVQHFSGLGLPRAIPLFWLIALAVNLALNFVFVPRFGAFAAAINSSIGYAIIFVLVAVLFHRRTGNGFGRMFFLRRSEWSHLADLLGRRNVLQDGDA